MFAIERVAEGYSRLGLAAVDAARGPAIRANNIVCWSGLGGGGRSSKKTMKSFDFKKIVCCRRGITKGYSRQGLAAVDAARGPANGGDNIVGWAGLCGGGGRSGDETMKSFVLKKIVCFRKGMAKGYSRLGLVGWAWRRWTLREVRRTEQII